MEVTWFGHSNFRIKNRETTILIDPFFVGNPAAPVTYKDIKEADLILVTHDHADHVGQTLELATRLDTEVVAIFDVIQSLIVQGLPESLGVGMNIGGTVVRYGIKIKMVQAAHSSATGSPAGFILTFEDGRCLYYAGDTGLFGDMTLFGERHDIDTAFLPIGGRFTMDAEDAAHACTMIGCNQVVPMHWGTWPILLQNLQDFEAALDRSSPSTKMVPMEIGKPFEI